MQTTYKIVCEYKNQKECPEYEKGDILDNGECVHAQYYELFKGGLRYDENSHNLPDLQETYCDSEEIKKSLIRNIKAKNYHSKQIIKKEGLLSTKEAAAYLEIDAMQLLGIVSRTDLPHYKFEGILSKYFKKEDLDKLKITKLKKYLTLPYHDIELIKKESLMTCSEIARYLNVCKWDLYSFLNRKIIQKLVPCYKFRGYNRQKYYKKADIDNMVIEYPEQIKRMQSQKNSSGE